jgi:hypothetical protein
LNHRDDITPQTNLVMRVPISTDNNIPIVDAGLMTGSSGNTGNSFNCILSRKVWQLDESESPQIHILLSGVLDPLVIAAIRCALLRGRTTVTGSNRAASPSDAGIQRRASWAAANSISRSDNAVLYSNPPPRLSCPAQPRVGLSA